MKKWLLLLPVLCLSGQALAKVSYEDALESNRPYHDANGAVHIPPDTEGLGPEEFDPDATNNGDLGRWVKTSNSSVNVVNAGSYSALLSPNSAGQACYKGTKELIMGTNRECHHWNTGGTHCQGSWVVTIADYGYKAECR